LVILASRPNCVTSTRWAAHLELPAKQQWRPGCPCAALAGCATSARPGRCQSGSARPWTTPVPAPRTGRVRRANCPPQQRLRRVVGAARQQIGRVEGRRQRAELRNRQYHLAVAADFSQAFIDDTVDIGRVRDLNMGGGVQNSSRVKGASALSARRMRGSTRLSSFALGIRGQFTGLGDADGDVARRQ